MTVPVMVTTIVITRELWPDGRDVVGVDVDPPTAALVETLGMVEMAKATLEVIAQDNHADDGDEDR